MSLFDDVTTKITSLSDAKNSIRAQIESSFDDDLTDVPLGDYHGHINGYIDNEMKLLYIDPSDPDNVVKYNGDLQGFTDISTDVTNGSGSIWTPFPNTGDTYHGPLLGLFRSYGIGTTASNNTDVSIFASTNAIDLTAYHRMHICCSAANSGGSITSKLYFKLTDTNQVDPAIVPTSAYDWTTWKLCSSSNNIVPYMDDIMIDVSGITGSKYLNFGVYHDNGGDNYIARGLISSITLY